MNSRPDTIFSPPVCKISVVICTRNPRQDYFQRTLEGIAAQQYDVKLWELLIIDNGSTKPIELPIPALINHAVRIIREDETGLTPARLCGIRHAKGEMLVFVDDDNILDPHYLHEAMRISRENLVLGAWGGCSLPEFEIPPPADIISQLGGLALGVVEVPVFSDVPEMSQAIPFGAGMCVRKEVVLHYLHMTETDPLRKSLDRTGTSYGAGGDTDLAYCACDLGMRVGRFPSLKLTHLIPKGRLHVNYIERIFEGFGAARVILPFIRNRQTRVLCPNPIRRLRTLLRWSLAYLMRDSQTRIRTRGHLGELKGLKLLSKIQAKNANP